MSFDTNFSFSHSIDFRASDLPNVTSFYEDDRLIESCDIVIDSNYEDSILMLHTDGVDRVNLTERSVQSIISWPPVTW